ncbi:PilC/PilY family type IV pilus protein [Paucibacter sp. AS339]|uniref:PilC/PilY family type IV pilus protein n=1 Tax=Paucibacter hankyongi TaxID=3133434 RepID=UPI0030ADEF56
MHTPQLKRVLVGLKLTLGLATAGVCGWIQAAQTDISQTPVLTASGTPVKPNLMFILDDSGSMGESFLPEAAGKFSSSEYGSKASQCNGLAFNPATTYTVPVSSTGVPYANPSVAFLAPVATADTWNPRTITSSPVSLKNSGSLTITISDTGLSSSGWSPTYYIGDVVTIYSDTTPTQYMTGTVSSWSVSNGGKTGTMGVAITTSSGSATLSSPKVANGEVLKNFYYHTYSGTQPRFAYTYGSTGSVLSTSTFYKECNSSVGSTPGSSVFTTVYVDNNSSVAQNYAIWYTYYSTRMLMMKTVVNQAFKDIDEKFRVGYNTILNTTTKESSDNTDFLHIRDFDDTQKSKFYDYLMGPKNSGYTPLRAALANAGRYYANKAPNQDSDPVQYSCQKNFVILATDGAWNTSDESTTYGPFQLDGKTKVGQQDGGSTARPMHDASSSNGSGGDSNSLADVAMYYYNTDLRNTGQSNCKGALGSDVCQDNVKPLGLDTAYWQHMTTYTLNLGQNGLLNYDPKYLTQTSGDYYNLTQNTKQWPLSVESSGSAYAANVDDLWHAAVNGRGQYFNAADPAAVAQSLKTALSAIDQITASGSAAATSTLRPISGNNQVFIGRFTSELWTGDLRAYKIDPDTGTPLVLDASGKDIADWSAAAKLKLNTARKIYYYKSGGLRLFTYSNLTADGFNGEVDNVCSKLSQCPALSSTEKTTANSGANLVSYLRGTELSVFRSRGEVLGDIIGSSPAYVGAPPLKYKDAGYAAYQSSKANRAGVVYVGGNDGMLHAFNASSGEEMWAYIPSAVRGNLYKLADNNYSSNHQFFVDGSPVVADISVGGVWKTVLICGLGAGGKSYFALDVTDPANPLAMWEFTDTNLGFSYAQPLVTKRSNGDWVAVFSSGLNNVGDGKGHLFMVNIATGAKVLDISTSAGSAATPSGLGPLNAWVESTDDNKALRFYGGDMLGNLWRFDTEGLKDPKNAALLLATVKVNGVVQPIATTPQLAEVNYKGFKTPVVYIGTGRLVGLTDLDNVDKQTVYGIKDDLGATGYGDIRAGSALVAQTLTTSGTMRVASGNPVDWTQKTGWYVDLPDSGERISVDMLLQFNTLTAASNVPKAAASCTSGGGYSWLYFFDIATGGNTGSLVATKISNAMVVGLSPFLLANGKSGVIVNRTDGIEKQPVPTPAPSSTGAKRTAWRELVDR